MLDNIVQQLTQKYGLPVDKARSIVLEVVDQLKTKLPGPIGSQIDTVLKARSRGYGEERDGRRQGIFGKKS